MDDSTRRRALGTALVLLAALDLVVARVDLLTPLVPDTLPTTLFTTVNAQVTDVVRAFYTPPTPGPPPVVLIGNSQMDLATRPRPDLADALVAAGAPTGTRVVSLCVYATAVTDAEVTARNLEPMRPGLVVLGIAPPDVGSTLERARLGPVTRLLDVGFGPALVPPADLETRLDRWGRTVWHLYRYRTLFRDLLLPPSGRTTPRIFFDTRHSPTEFFETVYADRAAELLALRRRFEQSDDWDDVVRYVDELQGTGYLPGLRDRWRDLAPQDLQLEALRRFAAHVRDAGGRPVWVLMPENPVFEQDPEVGGVVRTHSDQAAVRIVTEAHDVDVPVIDLRHALPRSAFLDLNHLFLEHSGFAPLLAKELGRQQLL